MFVLQLKTYGARCFAKCIAFSINAVFKTGFRIRIFLRIRIRAKFFMRIRILGVSGGGGWA